LYPIFAENVLETQKSKLTLYNQKICVNEFLNLLESLDEVWKIE